jgi:hypothetical protein
MNDAPDIPTMPPVLAGLTFGLSKPLKIESMEDAWRVATLIWRAGMTPTGTERFEQLVISLLYGAEIGLSPMQSVQRIAVIGNRPTIWGDAALSLCMQSPFFEEIDEGVEGEGDTRFGYCTVKRRGQAAKTSTFSVADAKQARLWDQNPKVERVNRQTRERFTKDNDSPWFKYPDRMLLMRARGYRLRDSFPDVLGGLYLREEFAGATIEGEAVELPAPTQSRQAHDPGVAHRPPAPPPPDRAEGPPAPPTPPAPPPPPAAPAKLSAEEAEALVEQFEQAAHGAGSEEALDFIWGELVSPLIDADRLDDATLNRLQNIDDARRGDLQVNGDRHE